MEGGSGSALRVLTITDEQETREMITIRVSPPGLSVGKQYRATINFVSLLNDELRGLYRSSYDQDGVTKLVIPITLRYLYKFNI